MAVLVAAGILLFGAAVVVGGGGHGVLLPLLVLFPFGPIGAHAAGPASRDSVGIATALLQPPLYGLILRVGKQSGRLRAAAIAVAGLHVIAIALSSRGWLW